MAEAAHTHTHTGLRYCMYFIRPTEILQGYTELQSSRQPQVGRATELHRAPGSKSTTSILTATAEGWVVQSQELAIRFLQKK